MTLNSTKPKYTVVMLQIQIHEFFSFFKTVKQSIISVCASSRAVTRWRHSPILSSVLMLSVK